MRILVTGSRDWEDYDAIVGAFYSVAGNSGGHTLVSGACPRGADALAEEIAERIGWTVERHPADWGYHGRRAGFVRNSYMVSLGADVCLAFIRNNSKGASMTARLTENAGIRTMIYRA